MESEQADEEVCRWEEEEMNWAELPRDVLRLIFNKVAAVGLITSAQFVCRPWRLLSREPELWRCIDMMNNDDRFKRPDLESIAIMAVGRSEGCLEEFYAEKFGTDLLMSYLAGRATQLRCLRLKEVYDITETTLVEALRTFPRLEELEASICIMSDKVLESISLACPKLKSLKVIYWKNLKSRALLLNRSDIGLFALLDNCPHLECLHINGCIIYDMDGNLKKKCSRIKDLSLPIKEFNNFW